MFVMIEGRSDSPELWEGIGRELLEAALLGRSAIHVLELDYGKAKGVVQSPQATDCTPQEVVGLMQKTLPPGARIFHLGVLDTVQIENQLVDHGVTIEGVFTDVTPDDIIHSS